MTFVVATAGAIASWEDDFTIDGDTFFADNIAGLEGGETL